ncbi:MAG: MGMT family protein [Tepidiformaceae bacterium]
MPTIHVDKLPNFYTRVYEFVGKVPKGCVVTYGQVALALGAPRSARAVGYALRNLPDGTDVPWWRVLNANGETSIQRISVTAADLQREILEYEKVNFRKGQVNLEDFRWFPKEFDEFSKKDYLE